jgi:hypothetical protein
MFDWRHLLVMFLVFAAGYWVAGKYPGLLTKATMGTVQG